MTFPRALARYTRGAVNNTALHLAGHAAFADLEHAGRNSGIVRHTPVRAFRTGNTVIIGLNFGRQSDWYQNINAAGTCRIRLGGERLTLGAPVLVPAEQATKDIPWLFRFALRHVVRTAECAQLPILHASPVPATRRQHSRRTRERQQPHPTRADRPDL
jgi:deazaflavin-dependent oxidoreductase (nitroreductase family)